MTLRSPVTSSQFASGRRWHVSLGVTLLSRLGRDPVTNPVCLLLPAVAYVNLGHVMALQGRVGAARRVLREGGALSSAGQRDPAAHDAARASALFHLATIEASVGDLAEAKRALDDALRVSPPGYDTRVSQYTGPGDEVRLAVELSTFYSRNLERV